MVSTFLPEDEQQFPPPPGVPLGPGQPGLPPLGGAGILPPPSPQPFDPGLAAAGGPPMPTSPAVAPAPAEPPRRRLPPPEPGSLVDQILRLAKGQEEEDKKTKRQKRLERMYPKPDEVSIKRAKTTLENRWIKFRQKYDSVRKYREHEDYLPLKWGEDLEDGRRAWLNWSNDEVLWARTNATRNPVVLTIPPLGVSEEAQTQADTQERFCNALMAALERRQTFWGRVVDQQHAVGLGAWLFYFTDAYEDIEFDQREMGEVEIPEDEAVRLEIEYELDQRDLEVKESKDGKKWVVLEKASSAKKRIAEELKQAGLPFGCRWLNISSVYFEEDGQDLSQVIVSERKTWAAARARVADALGDDEFVPPPSQVGGPEGGWEISGAGDVEVITYYDRRWYAYVVGGKLVEVKEHHLPRIPVWIVKGIETSSPDPSQAYQGVVHGMLHLEQAANDLGTTMMEAAVTTAIPRPYVQLDPEAATRLEQFSAVKNGVLDISGKDGAPLVPGEIHTLQEKMPVNPLVTNAFAIIREAWQNSALGSTSKGKSPGADTAGYALHLLATTELSKYRPYAESLAREWASFCDFVRWVIKHHIGEPVYLMAEAPGGDGGKQQIALGPNDIGNEIAPAEATIDSESEANKAAMQQLMMAATAQGFVPREVTQRKAFGSRDPALWRAMQTEDFLYVNVIQNALAEELQQVIKGQPPDQQMDQMAQMLQQQQGGGQGQPPAGGAPNMGATGLQGAVQQTGGTPAPVQPPAGVPASMMGGQQPTDQGRGQVPVR